MDPGSVVREGEQIMVMNTASLPDWLTGQIARVNGGSALGELRGRTSWPKPKAASGSLRPRWISGARNMAIWQNNIAMTPIASCRRRSSCRASTRRMPAAETQTTFSRSTAGAAANASRGPLMADQDFERRLKEAHSVITEIAQNGASREEADIVARQKYGVTLDDVIKYDDSQRGVEIWGVPVPRGVGAAVVGYGQGLTSNWGDELRGGSNKARHT